MAKLSENQKARDRKRRARLVKLGYSRSDAVEIVRVRSKLAARGVDLNHKLRQQCVTGKIVYPSARTAKVIARDLAMSSDRFNHNLHSYECRFCKMWHLTSTTKKRKKRLTK